MTDTYQWQVCDGADPGDGSTCVNVGGATSPSLALSGATGKRYRITGTRNGVTVTPAMSAVIAAAPPAGTTPDPPVGPFTNYTTAQWFRDGAHPATISKYDVHDSPDYGIAIMGFFGGGDPAPAASAFTITDCISERIGRYPTVSDGRAEAGLWLGYQANVNRGIFHGTWEDLWTGSSNRFSVIQNFMCAKRDNLGNFVQSEGIGIYNEHATYGCTFQNGEIFSTGNGINSEWWYADSAAWNAYLLDLLGSSFVGAGKAGSCNNHYTHLKVYCPARATGIFLDAGTFGASIDNIHFYGPGDAIALPNNRLGPASTVDLASCTFENSGRQVYYHSNAVGSPILKLKARVPRRLHPHTFRHPADYWERLREQHAAPSP